MFISYYKLNEQPFGVTPDPRFLYLTATHREAIASIVYSVMENRGFTALIAPPGMGKTTLMFELLHRFGDSVRTVFLFQFQPTPEGLLRSLLSELNVPHDALSFEAMQEKLNDLILLESKRGKRIVVVVDEAQNFREPVLEVLRMLSNFETSQDKLIHIILSGQPQLAEILFSPAIEQLRQRISVMAVLRPLSVEETRDYIEHRLRVAGHRGTGAIFTQAAYERIAGYSQGIPRNINNLCFHALSLGCVLRRPTIDFDLIDEVFRDLNLENNPEPDRPKSPPSTNPNIWTQTSVPPVASLPKSWPPIETRRAGKGLSLTAGIVSFAAVLCVGGAFARQYAVSANPDNVTLRAPAPPVPNIEVTTVQPAEAAPASAPETIPKQTSPAPGPASVPVASRREKTRTTSREQVKDAGEPPVMLVRVAQRQTLYELCARNLGNCDVNAIYEIRRMNPRLRNASHVESGEAVRLPLGASGSKRTSHDTKLKSGDKQ
ncbi:MAG TPA: AAA family ATPase [Candidatus Acidoferrum sp.]|nr:AAA family ATPase [Candidatus Acidoferrum sp.]